MTVEHDRRGDFNVRAAFLHMASDALVAAGVVVAGGLILLKGWHWLDPAISLVICAVIVAGTWSLLQDPVDLSLDAVPVGIDQEAVATFLGGLPGVLEVHDLHIWGLSTTDTALTAHLVRADATGDESLVRMACSEIQERFGIGHATIQFENSDMASACKLRPDHVV